MNTTPAVVDLAQKFELFQEHWTPKIVAASNGQLIKVAKFKGEFVWHSHADEDELFLVVKGSVVIRLRHEGQERDVCLNAGQLLVVPKGMEHKPVARFEAHVVMIEPASMEHTGAAQTDLAVAVADQDWI